MFYFFLSDFNMLSPRVRAGIFALTKASWETYFPRKRQEVGEQRHRGQATAATYWPGGFSCKWIHLNIETEALVFIGRSIHPIRRRLVLTS